MRLTFGYSPCPNDTFAFHALTHGLVETQLEIEPVLLDIFDIHEPTPSMRLQFPTVTDFLKSVYDHR